MSENKTNRPKPHFLTSEFQSQDFSIDFDVYSWFEYLADLPKLKKAPTPNQRDVAAANKIAEALWNMECERFDQSKAKDRNHQFLLKSISEGTFADKLSALNVMIVSNPLQEIAPNRAFDSLFKLLDETNINKQQDILDAIKNTLFILLGDYKDTLTPFSSQNLLSPTLTPRHLLMFRFIQELEACYLRFLSYLEKFSHSQLAHNRLYSGKVLFDLIVTLPKISSDVILSIMIDKLGDSEAKISTNFKHYIKQLADKHPDTYSRTIIKQLCEKIITQKSLTPLFSSALLCLTSLQLKRDWTFEASMILNTYLSAFHTVVTFSETKPVRSKEKSKKISKKMKNNPNAAAAAKATLEGTNVLSSKQVTYILTGIHRVIPFVPNDIVNSSKFKENISKIYDIIPNVTFSTAITALTVLAEVETKMENQDRIYTVLYNFMQNADFRTASVAKTKIFVDLVFDVAKADVKPDRAKAFVLQLATKASYLSVPFAAQSFISISQLIGVRPEIGTICRKNLNEDEYNPRAPTIFEGKPETTSLWMATAFLRHYHPSLQIFAQSVLNEQPINYTGDTVADFRTMNFLDKLVDKKAKSRVKGTPGVRLSDSLINMKDVNVPESEKYIYEFLKRSSLKSASKKYVGDLDEDEVDEIIRKQLAKEEGLVEDSDVVPSDDEDWEGWSDAADLDDDDMADELYGGDQE